MLVDKAHGRLVSVVETPPFTISASPFVWSDPAVFPRRDWLYARHLIRKYLSCTVAPPGIGKTSLLLVEAVAMATGRNLLGKQVHGGPHRVWFICLEDPLEELQRRVLAILLHYGIDPEELGGRLFLDSGRTAKVVIATSTRNGAEIAVPVVDAFRAEIKAKAIGVVVVDPLVKAHRCNENDNMAIDMVCTELAGIADEARCSFELIHHIKKTGGAEATVEDGRGASALLGAVRSARVLNPMSKDEAEKAGNLNHRLFFRDQNGKLNLAVPADRADWYQLKSVSLGNGRNPDDVFDFNDQSDLVGVASSWEWPNLTDSVTINHLRSVQNIVSKGRFRENLQAGDWVGTVVAQVMGLDVKNKGHREQIKAALTMWFASGALTKVEGLDKHREPKLFVEVGEWAAD